MLTRKQSRKFFKLPLQRKQAIAHIPGPDPQRGWSSVGSEKTSAVYEKIAEGGEQPSNSADAKVSIRLAFTTKRLTEVTGAF
jgi:isopenicillin N synthase-like dioxygenase